MKLGVLMGMKDSPHSISPSTIFVSNRRIGVELEYENIRNHPSESLDLSLWDITEDGSLRTIEEDTFSLELRYAAALGGHDSARAMTSLKKFLARNKDIQCTERTGLHVHIDFRDIEVAQLRNFVINYLLIEPFLYEYCGHERENSIFCIPLYKTPYLVNSYLNQDKYHSSKTTASNIARLYKYSGLNLLSIQKKGSVEFRMHKSTTNVNSIIAWINILLSLVQSSLGDPINVKKLLKDVRSGRDFLTQILGIYGKPLNTNNFQQNLAVGEESLCTFMCTADKSSLLTIAAPGAATNINLNNNDSESLLEGAMNRFYEFSTGVYATRPPARTTYSGSAGEVINRNPDIRIEDILRPPRPTPEDLEE